MTMENKLLNKFKFLRKKQHDEGLEFFLNTEEYHQLYYEVFLYRSVCNELLEQVYEMDQETDLENDEEDNENSIEEEIIKIASYLLEIYQFIEECVLDKTIAFKIVSETPIDLFNKYRILIIEYCEEGKFEDALNLVEQCKQKIDEFCKKYDLSREYKYFFIENLIIELENLKKIILEEK